jgi:TetR/AcrR family acrAB operon transcriptional repressor
MTKSENEERRQNILDVASDLFLQYGYDKTTVSDIARGAGVSKGAIYLHFNSKDALLEALWLRETRKYVSRLLDLLEDDPDGGRIGTLYRISLVAMNASPFMAAIYSQDNNVFGNYLRKPGNIFQKMRERQQVQPRLRFVTLMQEAGAIRKDIDPSIVAHIMTSIGFGLIAVGEILEPQYIPPLEDVFNGLGDFMDRALTPEDGGNPDAALAIFRQMYAAGEQQMETIQQHGFESSNPSNSER